VPGRSSALAGRMKRMIWNQNIILTICLALAGCALTLHPIVAQPPIPDAEAVQRLCLDYMRQAVPAASLAEAVGVANERQAVFDKCLLSHGWAE
jgi:hypothetical protein